MKHTLTALYIFSLVLPCIAQENCETFMEFRNPHPDSIYGHFGSTVHPLANGNVVITSPDCDGNVSNGGAVHLYKGKTGELISGLYGSYSGDRIGSGGIVELPNGHFVVISPDCGNGTEFSVGAVTWVNGNTGLNGQLSLANSIMGNVGGDRVGFPGVMVVGDSNYVVMSRNIVGLNGGEGAATWCDGSGGTTGHVSELNSLVGSQADEYVTGPTNKGVMVFPNGNYLVFTSNRSGNAVTWASGNVGVVGTPSATNSLVGTGWISSVPNSSDGVIMLTNGNCVILSPTFDRGEMINAGAATWCSSTSGVTGELSTTNSLLGAKAYAEVGKFGAIALKNGHYLVTSLKEVTWCDGTTGRVGEVTAANSLIDYGTSVNALTVVPFEDGNYLICDPTADVGGYTDAGAVTWFDGSAEAVGAFNPANSFVGAATYDRIGDQVLQVADGNYVILGHGRGTSTFVSAGTGITGVVSTTNSLMWPDSSYNKQFATILANGNYVLYNYRHRTSIENSERGGVLWCDGTTGRIGWIQDADLLLGDATDRISDMGVVALPDGNYVVLSSGWKNDSGNTVGAATWCSGSGPTTGSLDMTKTSIGSAAGDSNDISCVPLHDGNYVIVRPRWDREGSVDHGAITWSPADSMTAGEVTALNSVVGGVGSLLGTSANALAPPAITVLIDGDYTITDSNWSGFGMTGNGAIRWCSGTATSSGELTASNSIIGPYDDAEIGLYPVLPLPTGGYVAQLDSANGDPAGILWGDGDGAPVGLMSNQNSLMSPPGSSRTEPVLDPVNEQYYAVNIAEEPNGKVKVGSYHTGGFSIPVISVRRSPGNSPLINDLADVYFQDVAIGNDDTHTLHITNVGSWPLELGTLSVGSPGTDAFQLNLTSLETTVYTDLYTSVPITYDPIEPGNFNSILSIPSNDANTGTFRVGLLVGNNWAPTFAPYPLEAWNAATLVIPVADLYENASDPESRIAWISLLGSSTIEGGSIRMECGNLIYTTPASPTATDSFSVLVHDAGGLIVSGTVNVALVAPPVSTPGLGSSLQLMSDGRVGLDLFSAPFELRNIEVSQNLVDWQRITSVSADSNGRIRLVDHSPPLLKAFYRAVEP